MIRNFSLTNIFDAVISFFSKTDNWIESFAKKGNSKRVLCFFVLLFVFCSIFLLNILTPLIADDYAYQLIFGTKDYVHNIRDIVTSQINHYDAWGGRSIVHFIAQTLLLLPPLVADFLNTTVFILFTFLVYLHIKGRGNNSLSLFVLINLAVWFFVPMFGDTVLWMTGSANYLWGTSIVLLFLLPYRLYEGHKMNNEKTLLISPLFLLAGIVTGWTNENTVAGLIVMILLFFLYYRSQKWIISVPHLIGLIGVLIGYALMIMAPGNFKRGGDVLEVGVVTIISRLFSYTQTLFLDYGYLILIFVILVILVNKEQRKNVYLSFIYLIGGFAAIYAMIFSPQFPPRAWFGIVTFMIIAVGLVLYSLDYKKSSFKAVVKACILIGALIFISSYLLALKDVYRMYNIDKERIVQVNEAKERGDKECVFYMNRPQTKYLHEEDINGNHLLVHHYGIHIEYK